MRTLLCFAVLGSIAGMLPMAAFAAEPVNLLADPSFEEPTQRRKTKRIGIFRGGPNMPFGGNSR